MYSLVVLLFLRHVIGVPITILNPGFEAQTIPDSSWLTGVQNWDLYDPSNLHSLNEDDTVGIHNPTDSQMYTTHRSKEGSNCAYVYMTSNQLKQGDVGLVQQLNSVVSVNTRYTLSVFVGNPATDSYPLDGFPGYAIDLLAGDDTLVTDNNSLSIDDGYWLESTITVDIFADNPFIGQTLSIRLRNMNEYTGQEVNFDLVRLNATDITPNPTVDPTTMPTKAPSMPPTSQSIAPTRSSTQPTTSPTTVPTKPPTKQPTQVTSYPSTLPTTIPTKVPTTIPTNTPTIIPTKHLTVYPTAPPTETTETFSTEGDTGVDSSSNTPSSKNIISIVIIVLLSAVCTVVFAFVCVLCRRYKLRRAAQKASIRRLASNDVYAVKQQASSMPQLETVVALEGENRKPLPTKPTPRGRTPTPSLPSGATPPAPTPPAPTPQESTPTPQGPTPSPPSPPFRLKPKHVDDESRSDSLDVLQHKYLSSEINRNEDGVTPGGDAAEDEEINDEDMDTSHESSATDGDDLYASLANVTAGGPETLTMGQREARIASLNVEAMPSLPFE